MSNQQIFQTLTKLQDQDFVEVIKFSQIIIQFFDDTVSYLKGARIPFLTKYGESLAITNVVPLRDFLLEVIQVGLRKSPPTSTLDFVKDGITNFATDQNIYLEAKQLEMLSVCVFSRREELRKVLTELIFQGSVDHHLVDYNYNIELCLSSDKYQKVNEAMLVLELYLKGSDGKQFERVVIEMDKNEAKHFVAKLREIERELIGSSQ